MKALSEVTAVAEAHDEMWNDEEGRCWVVLVNEAGVAVRLCLQPDSLIMGRWPDNGDLDV